MLLSDQIYLHFSSLFRCQNHFRPNRSLRNFSSGGKYNSLTNFIAEFLRLHRCTTVDGKEKFLTFLRFELFFFIFSLLTVSTAQLTEGLRVPFNFNTSVLRALLSAGWFAISTSVIVLDDDCTQGRHILLLFMTKVQVQSTSESIESASDEGFSQAELELEWQGVCCQIDF